MELAADFEPETSWENTSSSRKMQVSAFIGKDLPFLPGRWLVRQTGVADNQSLHVYCPMFKAGPAD
jgi:hypothetical protein